SPERAIMEQMRLVKVNDDVEQAYRLMEGLTTLRPSVVQDLLVNCRSVKVKRLFLWSAETIGHAWFGRLDLERVELGNGRRQLYKGGRLNLKYQITVPAQEELPGV
ncbi:type IV toxin-antitoxin system AbiEi family antitoxin domain-containing protein, partial [bacterium]|nr:type IV toxin-antitoxin system AbiEi family antitoxin domain-containing protein [bacterium]